MSTPRKLTRQVVDIIFHEATSYGVTVEDVLSGIQIAHVMSARRVAIRLRARGMSLHQIGRYLGRHHTSVLAMLKHKSPAPVLSVYDPCSPDLGGEWAI